MSKTLVLVLGGAADREERSVKASIAQDEQAGGGPGRQKWPIWLSGPALSEDAVERCVHAGCDARYLLIDYEAVDTLSNFTTLVDLMREHSFKKVHLATSSLHMPRAVAIAEIILPAYGLRLGKKIKVEPSRGEPDEPAITRYRDVVRAWLWLWFGFDFAAPLLWLVHPDRMRHRDRRVKTLTYRGECCYGD
ncbi:Hypothetical Protein FCC1311_075422 [Hondaea fermentalgiana]|uniref:DUF218 domain-containing protein n=1 Tax=Hondaea fermentalgiana TaxID=2315210 RepID=A0A2R5GLX9_9STRA|nr:Hypothetical Protein FCC1311_075422 [Hondaea fermentalgiana]|eukprot:GBG31319.1 Hypothetical Protein FCC1311_075422 [Hondaea fermentalgiana]